MDSITHIFDNIDSFSKVNFKLGKFIELFRLVRHVPDKIQDVLNTDDFIYHLQEADNHMKWLNEYLEEEVMPTVEKEVSRMKKSDVMIPYADFQIPKDFPVFRKPKDMSDRVEGYEQLSFDDLNRKHIEETGRPIAPINRSREIMYKGNCPRCGAPNGFIYNNNGKGTQFLCKACGLTFTARHSDSNDELAIYCPHCGDKLSPKHDRKGYVVYVCPNDRCKYYLENKKRVDSGEGEDLRTSSNQYRLHYTYREFKFSFDSIKKLEEKHAMENLENQGEYRGRLSRIHVDKRTLGLVLCYYVNYGLSSRKTALILRDIHGISISHQTVANYGKLVSRIIEPMVTYYPYRVSSNQTGDETYIKIRGRNHYVFFWSDTEARIITSFRIYKNRSTLEAVKSIHDLLIHYGGNIPDDLTLITDGNPIYNASQMFYKLNGVNFELYQVIGVSNRDKTSKEWRPNKQREERLNRTYKQNYYGTNGYDTLEGANRYMVLYVAYYNFLRVHSALNYRTPVDDHLFDDCDLMPDKWLKLIDMSARYALQF